MFIVIDWALMTLITGLFLLVYFMDIRLKSLQIYSNLRITEHLEYIIDGILYGGLFLLFYFTFNDLSFRLSIFVVAGILLTLTKDYRVSLISLFLPLITIVTTNEITDLTYISVAMVYGFIFIQVIVSHFVDFPLERQISLSVILGISLVVMTAFAIVWDDGMKAFSSILVPIVLTIYTYLIVSYSIRTSESANALYKTINYTFSNYYRNTMKERVILEYVSNHKLKYGVYGLLNIDIDNVQSKNLKNEILESVLLEFESIMPDSALLFKSREHYGFFLPKNSLKDLPVMIHGNHNLTRTNIDPLLSLQRILESIPKSYRTTTSTINKVSVIAGVSLYGIQNQSIEELDTMAEYALKIANKKRDNVIAVFEPKSYRKRINDSEDLKNLNRTIGLDNFSIEYQPIYNSNTRDKTYILARQRLISDTMIVPSIKEFKEHNKSIDTFDRFFSANAIKNFKVGENIPLIIRYSPIILDKKFNIHEFIVFIDKQDLLPSEIIIEFEDADFKYVSDHKSMHKNIEALRGYGIKIAVFVSSDNGLELINKIDPSILIFDNLKLAKEVEDQLNTSNRIIIDLKTEEQFKSVNKFGIENFSGSFIETNT